MPRVTLTWAIVAGDFPYTLDSAESGEANKNVGIEKKLDLERELNLTRLYSTTV